MDIQLQKLKNYLAGGRLALVQIPTGFVKTKLLLIAFFDSMSTPLEEILAKITATEAKLKRAEDANDTERIARLENLLIELQRKENILLTRAVPSTASSAAGATVDYNI